VPTVKTKDAEGMSRHGDAAISRCLAWYASNMNGMWIEEFQTGAPKADRWDKTDGDDDNDFYNEGAGAW